jgi:hypothetical protein
MSKTDPQILYMVLIIPSLFGLTLIGDGISKIVREGRGGVGFVSLFFGLLFIGSVIFVYVFLSSFLDTS